MLFNIHRIYKPFCQSFLFLSFNNYLHLPTWRGGRERSSANHKSEPIKSEPPRSLQGTTHSNHRVFLALDQIIPTSNSWHLRPPLLSKPLDPTAFIRSTSHPFNIIIYSLLSYIYAFIRLTSHLFDIMLCLLLSYVVIHSFDVVLRLPSSI